MDSPGGLVVARLDGASQLRHVRNGVGLEQVLVVEVVEQDVQPAFGIIHLCFEGRRGPRLHALHVCGEDLIDRHGIGRDVGTVTGGYEKSETEATNREVWDHLRYLGGAGAGFFCEEAVLGRDPGAA